MSTDGYREIRLRDGRRLAYVEYGDAAGQPIVWCHGSPSSRAEGSLVLQSHALASGLRVIMPDRPGMGQSDFQRGRQIIDWPRDVLDLATALGLDTFAVIGSSGGAPYAAACGALIPDRVRAIGLLGGLAPLDRPDIMASVPGPLRLMFRLARYTPPLLGGLFRLNLRMMRAGGERAGERMAASFPEPDRSLFARPEVRHGFMACFEEACRRGVRGPVQDVALLAKPWGFDLGQIAVPVLLWHGERDGNVPVAHGRHLAKSIPGCRATFYPNEAHLSLLLNHHNEILGSLAGVGVA
jgi:pimeloyl-ACP methyl ester carboxylesterase